MVMEMLRKLRVEPEGMILLSMLMLFLDWELLVILLCHVVIHEWGHLYMLRRCGVFIRRISLGFGGLCIVCNTSFLSRRKAFLCAAAGPAVGLAISLAASFFGNLMDNDRLLLFAGVGAVLSLFNLLPVRPLDGWRMVSVAAPGVAGTVGTITAVVVMVLGLVVMSRGYGTALAFMGVLLLLQDGDGIKKVRKHSFT